MQSKIKGIKIFKNNIFYDNRGSFREIYKKKKLKINKELLFSCLSISKKNVIRGLHLQTKNSQAKFLTVVKGKIFDVALDLRKNSRTFGKHFSIYLSDKSYSSIYIPKGFAHGFCSLDKENIVYYGCTNYQEKKNEIGILWNDTDLKIKWPIKKPILSKKDKKNILFKEYCKNYYLKKIDVSKI
jgi:dTDP-4-dehydrorhamnose 3,5-epimerase